MNINPVNFKGTQIRFSLLFFLIICGFPLGIEAQGHERYIPESDSLVKQKLSEWQDLKFGLLMHWGTYSQWGIVESWSICPEEYGWCERKSGTNPGNYFEYVQEYEKLKSTFNPTQFNPEKWAKAAKDAGMRYMIFTTKHHDGFCMFDSRYTDYKITDPGCPFSASPRSNITLEIFDAFRKENLWVGAYFSKPDWHSPFYWDPKYPPRDRNVNYNPEENPEEWNQFVEFTHNQILELMSDYGPVDILWLDGGWVRYNSKEEIENWYAKKLEQSQSGYLKNRIINQDIKMDTLVAKARKLQPGLIVVDRAVEGKNQNYLTPENRVPDKTLPFPWESCIISGGGWSFTPNARYMSGHDAIQLLVEIVSKGGNLLLNIAPSPEGEWQDGAYKLLEEYAAWMKINSEAIYGTKPLAPWKEGNILMSQKDKDLSYFYYLCKEGENKLPAEISITSHQPVKGSKVTLLGLGEPLQWKPFDRGFKVFIPEKLRSKAPCSDVWTIKIEGILR